MPSITKGTRMGFLSNPSLNRGPRWNRGSEHRSGPDCSDAFLLIVWFVCGLLAVVVPLIWRALKMNRNYYNYNGNQNRNQNYSRDVNNCRWYQFNCQSYVVNENGDRQDDQIWTPGWYSGWADSEQEREQALAMGRASGSLKFVYFFLLLMFIGILYYGSRVINKKRGFAGLLGMLLIWANFCFMSMWLIADGSIVTDSDLVPGFYGQFAVLVFMTNFWYFLFGLGFGIFLALRAMAKVAELPDDEPRGQELPTSHYQAYSETPVQQQMVPVQPQMVPVQQPVEQRAPAAMGDSDEEFVKVV